MSERFSWPSKPQEQNTFEAIRSSLLMRFAAGTIALNACAPERQIKAPPSQAVVEQKPITVDAQFVFHKNGELTPEERADNTFSLAEGVTLLDDAGVFFYRVCKGDRTKAQISAKLAAYPEFEHLKTQTYRLESYNIPDSSLEPDMWIPIPRPNAERVITPEQFSTAANAAIDRILQDKLFGPTITHILEKPEMTRDKFIASLMAIAKQESGGAPLGQFEFQRFEPRYRAYSYSIFHILMSGVGLKVRRQLGMTEGQTYNLENAMILFFAYVTEKSNQKTIDPADFFPPTGEAAERFATFYNGGAWREYTPDYATNIERYFLETQNVH